MMAKPWNEHRHNIVRLYIDEGRTLEDVRGIMKTQYGFEASIRSYRQHFDQWRVGKYNCKKRLQRRRESLARPLLPSPPRTPDEAALPALSEGGTVGTSSSSSPGSVSTRSGSQQHSPEQRALPEPPTAQHHRRLADVAARFPPPFFGDNNGSNSNSAPHEIAVRGKDPRGWGDDDLQAVLRTEGILPFIKVEMDSDKLPAAKYLRPHPDSTSWNMARSAPSPFQVGGLEPADYYRVPFHDAVPRCMPEMFSGAMSSFSRPADYRSLQRSLGSVPKLPEERAGSHAGRERNVHQQQLAGSQMSFEGLASV
ncbi:hypothetical protein AK830_g5615 [Neonectria ditissima]|uniref:Clr5 domain-containing protein n=1 Tax=Neonectria ditissima TaxID=78410 RepID=A0A0P7BKI4_9HYPO|nr:hypothetical protein AK830_g5615 [Neonectria ditissima]